MSSGFPSNPFATRFTRPGSFEFRWGDPRDRQNLVDLLEQSRVGFIVGPHGSGKSTLLCSLMSLLASRFSEVASLQLHASERGGIFGTWRHRREAFGRACQMLRTLPGRGVLLLDGAEQLSDRGLRRVLSLASQNDQFVLATSHAAPMGLPVLYRTQLSPRAIRDLTRELLSDQDEELICLVESELDRRDLSKQTSLRDLWFDLYDVVQTYLLHAARHP